MNEHRSDSYDCEVKSSVNRYNDLVEINSQFQLKKTDRPLHLCYVVFQKSEAGLSVEDMISRLESSGIKRYYLEAMVHKRGYSRKFGEKGKISDS